MSGLPDFDGPVGPDDTEAEAQLRRLLSERVDGLERLDTPYEVILSRGRAARLRARIAAGAGAATLAIAMPATAVAVSGVLSDDAGSPTPAQAASQPATGQQSERSTAAKPSQQAEAPSNPERQLLDGVTLQYARDSVDFCLEQDRSWGPSEDPEIEAKDLRIILAWVNQGDFNSGKEPITRILAVSSDPASDYHVQIVCNVRPSEPGYSGMQSSIGGVGLPTDGGPGPIYPDDNSGRYYTPSYWEAPYRWAEFGAIDPKADPAVDEVYVTYGDETVEAVQDAGYFVAAGISEDDPSQPRACLEYAYTLEGSSELHPFTPFGC